MRLKYQYIIGVLFLASLFGQFRWYNHPELEWQTLETEHFKIHLDDICLKTEVVNELLSIHELQKCS